MAKKKDTKKDPGHIDYLLEICKKWEILRR